MQSSGGNGPLNVPQSPPPAVSLKRISQIQTYEVMESDLAELERVISDEAQALGFWTFLAGIAIPTALGWYMGKDVTLEQKVIYALFTFVPGVLSFWFLLVWWRKKKQRPSILSRIRHTP
ncbi:hypothetical protein [Archangium sp.]|jgi:hypothetical protein|uniref:hypothetical protein n=1 Tax=Archangium sp. TaxID=1872627 RepID=UPI002EDAF5D8